MPASLEARHAAPTKVVETFGAGNPIVSVDRDGNTLSRLEDDEWFFVGSKDRPRSRVSVRWPKACGPSAFAAKQLVYLRLKHGRALSPSTAYGKCRLAASLAVFCTDRGVELNALHRQPQVVIDFVQSRKVTEYKNGVIALARFALSMRHTLGWTFLEADQIAALEHIRTLDSRQYPVIPIRIYNELDEVAHAVLCGYLAVADQLDEISAIRVKANTSTVRTTMRWDNLLSQRPLLAAEFSKWLGNSRKQISSYVALIRSAACWVIGAGSCARRAEIRSIRRGCLTRERVGEHVACLMRAATTKTQNNLNAIWVVSPRVERAIEALERLLLWYERTHPNPPRLSDRLLQVFDGSLGLRQSPSRQRKGKNHVGEPTDSTTVDRLMRFADTRITHDDWAEAKRLTPTLDERKFSPGKNWVPSLQQLRRTVLVYAAASGLVSQDSLAFQAKHQTWKMTSYYCQHYWHLANTDPTNPIFAGTRQSDSVEFTELYADAYNRARSEAMDEDRLFSPYGRDHKRSVIGDTPLLSLEEIRTGLARAVLKRNTLGICAQADYCEWQKAITVRGCMTKADGDVCAKAIIDADRVGELRALYEGLTCQLENMHARDSFAREQIEADIAATVQAIELIEQHARGQHAEA